MRCPFSLGRIALITALGLSAFAATAQKNPQPLNPDQLEAAIADRTPGFAGYTYREDGTAVARMVESSGGYNARELLTYKERAMSTAMLNGVIAASINRESNRLEVAYNAALNAEEVKAAIARLEAAGVPMAAVTLRPSEPMRFRAQVGQSIQTQTPPLAGGSQIVSGFGTSSAETECSMGVAAIRDGVVGFVTASHCGPSVFSFVSNNTFFSPTLQSPLLGNEAADPTGTSCQAQANRGCRESDAMFVAAASDVLMDFGKILRSKSLTVTGTIDVVGTTDYPSVGRVVHKTGRSTGTRAGRIARTCVDTLLSDGVEGNYLVQCATEVDNPMFSSPGDSGAAIWISVSGGAKVAGILSYGNGSTTGFSPWGSVVKELGALTIR
jgi:hypothetical protein